MFSLRISRLYTQLRLYKTLQKAVLLPNHQINNINKRYINIKEIINSEDDASRGTVKRTQAFYDGLKNEEHLSRLMVHIAADIKVKNRVYRNDLKNAIDKASHTSFVSERDGILLLRCCTNLLPDELPENRLKMLHTIWDILMKSSKINIEHYHEVLRSYIDNKHKFSPNEFVKKLAPMKPDEETFKLLLFACCQMGNVNQALEVLENIKAAEIPLAEYHFNYLIEAYGKQGDMAAALKVLNEMKSLGFEPSNDTKKSLIKAYAYAGDERELENEIAAIGSENTFNETQLLDIVTCLVENNKANLIAKIIALLPNDSLNQTMSMNMQSLCTRFIHQGHYIDAYHIFSHIAPNDIGNLYNTSVYGRIMLRECIKASDSIEDIKYIVNGLIDSERNVMAAHMAYEASIHFGKFDISLQMLDIMNERKNTIRSHFFWPLFVTEAKKDGENGVFKVLNLMKTYNVTPNFETLTEYVLPNVNLTSPNDAIKKFQSYGLTSTNCLTPIVYMLLKCNDLRSAAELCELSDGKIDGEHLIFPLLRCYLSNGDADSLHNVLRAAQSRAKFKKDWIGQFLMSLITFRKWKVDVRFFNDLVKVLVESETKISPQAIDSCLQALERFDEYHDCIDSIRQNLNLMRDLDLVDQSVKEVIETNQNMTIDELEIHLIELESKEMNTRGVLRKLLQLYCQNNEFEKAQIVLDKCAQSNVVFSAGMLAFVMDMHIKSGNLQQAELFYSDLKKLFPKFTLDEFKMIDLATLYAKNNKLKTAISILKERSLKMEVKGGRNIETNCWKLLNTIASTGNYEDVRNMLSLLVQLDYCKISNIMLGPLIRVHLNRNDIPAAVEEFLACAEKYRKTPLKFELLTLLVKGCNEESDSNVMRNEYKRLLGELQDADHRIHGFNSSQTSLIIALADCGLTKPLRRLMLQPALKLNQDMLLVQCQRLIKDKKLEALENVCDSLHEVRGIDVELFHELSFKAYNMTGDCDRALQRWENLVEKKITPTKATIDLLSSMLTYHHKNLPISLLPYLKTESASIN